MNMGKTMRITLLLVLACTGFATHVHAQRNSGRLHKRFIVKTCQLTRAALYRDGKTQFQQLFHCFWRCCNTGFIG